MISYDEAYALTLQYIQPLAQETVLLLNAGGRIAAEALYARVDSPSVDVSLKDGYALRSRDVSAASRESPIQLILVGRAVAGQSWQGHVEPGQAVRILSGGALPSSTDAVVAEEFAQEKPGAVVIRNTAEPGRNVLPRGADLCTGDLLFPAGQRLYPTVIGLLAAAGFAEVPVFRRPQVAVLATGDEVLAPGQSMVAGKLYASNLFTLASWCLRFGFDVETLVLPDDQAEIRRALILCLEQYDAVLTSGGAWKGERDLVVGILDELGWQKIYHRVRMGPGKAVGFGIYAGKPVFCLPGGPPSNHMAFLQLALPGLLRLAGDSQPGLLRLPARLNQPISGQADWTQFIHGRLVERDQQLFFEPLRFTSRLQEMAQTQAIAVIPEGQEKLCEGRVVMVQKLTA